MAEFLTGMKRTKMCGLFSREDEGLEVVPWKYNLCGLKG